jgi:hypothetical protein
MDFDRYLESFDDDAGGKEQAALAIYYLETEEENSSASQSEIRSLIRTSRSTVSPSGTTSYFNRLDDAEWITPVGNNEYRTTPKERRRWRRYSTIAHSRVPGKKTICSLTWRTSKGTGDTSS